MDITDNIPLHQGNIPRSEVIVLTKMPLTFDITANKSSVHKFDSAMPFVIYIAISVNEVKNVPLEDIHAVPVGQAGVLAYGAPFDLNHPSLVGRFLKRFDESVQLLKPVEDF